MTLNIFSKLRLVVLVLAAFSLFTSCNSSQDVVSNSFIQKRKYTKGHHFNIGSKKRFNPSTVKAKKANGKKEVLGAPEKKNLRLRDLIQLAQDARSLQVASLISRIEVPDSTASKCATLHLVNGKKVSAKILEIRPDEIKYRRCSMLDGPDFILKKALVEKIVFSNGEEEDYSKPSAPPEEVAYLKSEEKVSDSRDAQPPVVTYPPRIEGFSLASLIVSFLGLITFPLFLFSLIALALGFVGNTKIRSNPERWKGKELATVGLIVGLIGILLGLFFWTLFLLSFSA